MYTFLSFISQIIRGLQIFNPFQSCGETISIPFTQIVLPTFVVEVIYPPIMGIICFLTVAVGFGYQKGFNEPIAGVILFLLTYCLHSLFFKLIVFVYPSWLLIVIITIVYKKIFSLLTDSISGNGMSYEHRMMSSKQPITKIQKIKNRRDDTANY